MKRKDNTETMGAVIRRLLKAYGLEEKMHQAAVVNAWDKLMGPAIASRTRRVILDKGVLTIYIESTVIRQEMLMARTRIAEMINREVELDIVKEVVIR